MRARMLFKLVVAILIAVACSANFAADILRQHVAVFSEEGFPSRSPRPVDWYKKTLEDAGLKVTVLGVKEFCDVKHFNREKYDTLIVATGGLLPTEAEYALGMFMRGGGTVVVDGSMGQGFQTASKEVMDEAARLRKDSQSGKNIKAYNDYTWKQRTTPGVMFSYSDEMKRWVPDIIPSSGNPVGLCGEFEFEPWPNPYQINPESYGRPFSEDLKINPATSEAGWAKFLPSVLPLSIQTETGEIVKAVPRENMMLRWTKFDQTMGDGRPSHEFVNDILLPLYLFDRPSGIKYSAFSTSGTLPKDCESDFFMYRSHRALKEGYTLVHFGWAGAHLLKSKDGKQVLLGALKIAESRFPGERSVAYVSACNRIESAMEKYTKSAIGGIGDLCRLARAFNAAGDAEGCGRALKQAMDIQDRLREMTGNCLALRVLKMQPGESGIAERNALADRCEKNAGEIESTLAEPRNALGKMMKTAVPGSVENPWGKIFLGFDFATPGGLTRQLELARIAKDLGFSGIPIYGTQYSAGICKETGLTSGLRIDGTETNGRFSLPFDTARFDYQAGSIKPSGKSGWWDTSESRECYDQDIGSRIKALNDRHPEIARIFCMQESNMAWSMWDERMRQKLIKYLEVKYGSINVLNKTWGTALAKFDEVKLPAKRPESQVEHAVWEDWTRFREVYFIEEIRKPLISMIKKYGPRMNIMAYQSYCGQESIPAHGINYYDYGKILDWNTLEMGSLGPLRDEVMTADIAGFFHKSITPEWGATYACCMAGGDWLKFNLWNGVGWGQIGWCTFAGSSAALPYSNFVDIDNRVTQLGWTIKDVMKDFDIVGPIFLDGQREEPPVRIVYSPTTNRHTTWPGDESDKSFQSVSGYYRALQMLQVQARAIDEGAILDGFLPKECRFIILPETIYLNRDLEKKIRAFIEGGGTVLATSDAGRFNEHGDRIDSMLTLAGVATRPAGKAEIDLGNGCSYVAKAVAASRPEALEALFPDVEVVMKYTNGDAAMTRTHVGKGILLITGLSFGRQFLTEHSMIAKGGASARSPLDLMVRIVSLAGLEREYACNDMELVVRPWIYKGRKYLAITSPSRTDLVFTGSKVFPFERTPLLTPFELKVKGDWKPTDTAMGISVPCSYEKGFTSIYGLAPNPGGLVFALEPGKKGFGGKAGEVPLKLAETADVVSKPQTAGGSVLPFSGRIGSETGIVTIGGYAVSVAVESKTQGWGQGAVYLNVEKSGEKKRKKCEDGKTVVFNFPDKTLKFACEQVSPEMPIGVTGKMWEEERKGSERNQACRVKEEIFRGNPSIVLENGYVRARILPKLGGRLIEFIGCDDDTNQLYSGTAEVRSIADGGYVDIGGIEENLGQWPGDLWNQDFTAKILANTPETVSVQLISFVENKSVSFSFEKIFTLRAKEAKLAVANRLVNKGNGNLNAKIWIHPELTPGGEASLSDAFYFDSPGSVRQVPFDSGKNASLPNDGGWSVALDGDKRSGLIQLYQRDQVQNLYYQFNPEAANLEFGSSQKSMKAGEKSELSYELGLLQGVPDVCGANGGLVLSISISGDGVCRPNEKREVRLRGSALKEGTWRTVVQLEKDAKIIADIGNADWKSDPSRPETKDIPWNIGSLPDGEYSIVATVQDKSGNKQFSARRKIKIVGTLSDGLLKTVDQRRSALDELKSKPQNGKAEEWRRKIVRASTLLNEMGEAARSGDVTRFESLDKELNTLVKK